MPGENLLRSEAQERAAAINVHSYLIKLDVNQGDKEFQSDTTIVFDSINEGAETFIDAITASVSSIELNGEPLDPKTHSDGLRISLPNLKATNTLRIIAMGVYSNSGEGLHRFVDPADGEVYLYTQFEVPDARRMFPVFEQPDLKATFEFHVTAPSSWQVISNSTTPTPKVSGKLATWEFAPTPRISSYITALIAGPYSVWRDELTSKDGRKIPLGVFCRESLSEFMDPEYIFEKTKQGFEYFEKLFDFPYPFEKYDQLFVPDFNAGAMENAGAVTFTETYVFRSAVTDATKERRVVTILHELAHMWFGDLVTMKWWNDLWLNESFAEYASTLATAEATEWKGAWTTFASLEKNWAYRQDQLPSTHPIVATINDLEDVQVNFDGITYAKGASVLKQLVAWVGQEPFMRGVSSYFQKHQWQNTELKDLLVELEKESGRDLSHWSKLWLETAGVNTLKPEIATDSNGVITSFRVHQTAIKEQPTIRPHRLAIGFFELSAGRLERTHRVEIDLDGELSEINELVGQKLPDLVLLNDDDLAYAKIRLDENSRKVAMENLSGISDSLARTLVWTAAWDAARDAEAPASDFIDLVLNHIGPETESTTILTLLRQLVTTSTLYVKPESRKSTISKIADGLISLAEKAAAGSDSQLQFTKFVPQFASEANQLDWLKSVLDGSKGLAGLEIDQDLRWELITGLVVGGRYGEAEISNELKRDNTASGQKFAAAARAGLPTAETKAAAWHTLVETQDYSNTLVNSASLGFGRVLETDLLKPYIEKYMASALEIWNSRSYQIASYLLVNLYPMSLASKELATATQKLIDSKEISSKPALRRILVENLAGLERGLKAQLADN
ncbi:MAG: aminopeptidase N [Aquiluna sp.]|nr:aminopeptidase N [Aquiluna sp.]MCF8545231.1 aminopeptidase N [Aquiluna sp.]